jgi:hypothetical protein
MPGLRAFNPGREWCGSTVQIMKPTAGDKQRKRFFERGVAAFQRATGTEEDLYYCPICENAFTREALVTKQLTLEHVPPRALGGRALLLTCLDCQEIGSRQDAAMRRRTDLWDLNEALQGRPGSYKAKGGVTLDIGGHSIRADIDAIAGSATLIPWKKRNNPETFELAMTHYSTRSKAGDLKFNLTPRLRFDPRLSKVGDLKTAYLAAFAKFGYSYAFHASLDRVRDQIREPSAKILPSWWILPTDEPGEWPKMGSVLRPVEGLAVYLRTAIVVLPWPGAKPDPYPGLSEGRVKLEGAPVKWPRGMEMELDFQ